MDDDNYEMPGPLEEDEEPNRSRGVRFGEGQDTRNGGRKAGSPNRATIIRRVAKRRHRVKRGGKTQTLDTLQLVLRAVRTNAALGKIAAFDLQQELVGKFTADEAKVRTAVLFSPGKLTDEEWAAIYTPGTFSADDVIARFPHLHRTIQRQYEYLEDMERTRLAP